MGTGTYVPSQREQQEPTAKSTGGRRYKEHRRKKIQLPYLEITCIYRAKGTTALPPGIQQHGFKMQRTRET